MGSLGECVLFSPKIQDSIYLVAILSTVLVCNRRLAKFTDVPMYLVVGGLLQLSTLKPPCLNFIPNAKLSCTILSLVI